MSIRMLKVFLCILIYYPCITHCDVTSITQILKPPEIDSNVSYRRIDADECIPGIIIRGCLCIGDNVWGCAR